jgi:transposase-like protein
VAEPSETWCYDALRRARWPGAIRCLFCGGARITTHSKYARTPRQRYLCLRCRHTFTDLTGTPFARTNLPLARWFLCLRLMRKGLPTSDLAKALGVKWDTAAHMEWRIGRAAGKPGIIRQLREAMERAEGE